MEKQLPVQFIKCTEEQIQKMISKFDEGTNINLNLEKEPEEDPIMIPAGSQEQIENSI